MAFDSPVNTYSGRRLQPLYDARDAHEVHVNIGPSLTLSRGQILGQVTSSANDVQTLTVTGTPDGGSLTLSGVNPVTRGTFTVVVPYNASSASAQTLVNAAVGGSGLITVGGGSLPGTPLTFTAAGSFAAMPIAVMTVSTNALTGGTAPAATVAHTTTGRTANSFAKYDSSVAAVPTAPVLTGAGTSGTWPAGAHVVSVTGVNAQGETTPSKPSGITLTNTQSIHIAAIASLDTSFTALNVYVDGMFAGTVAVTAGTSAAGDFAEPANTGVGSADKVKPAVNTAYTIPNGAGTQTAKAILPWDIATGASGSVTFGTVNGGGEWGEIQRSLAVFVGGYFATQDLVGLDAKAVADLGKLTNGTTSTGVLRVN